MIQKIINFDDVTKENIKEYNPNWPQIPDHPYKIFLSWNFWIWKMYTFLNLINHELDIYNLFYMLKTHIKQNINF